MQDKVTLDLIKCMNLSRLVNIALPRVKDFRGLTLKNR